MTGQGIFLCPVFHFADVGKKVKQQPRRSETAE